MSDIVWRVPGNPVPPQPPPDDSPYLTEEMGDARYERLLGDPAVDLYVLASLASGVRLWVPQNSGGAPTDATYITQTPNGSLSAEQALSALATGIVKNTTTTGILSIAVADTDYATPGSVALKAPLASPALTGAPTAPTATPGTNTTQVGTTAFTADAVDTEASARVSGDATNATAITTEATARAAADTAHAALTVTAHGGVIQASTRVGKLVFGGTSYCGAPGVIFGSQSTATLSANEVRYFPFYVDSPVTALLIQLEITSVAAGGKLCRMGICTGTFATFLPLAALVDAGSVAADSLGVKAVAINQALAIGLYFLLINSDGTPTVRTVRGQLAGAFLLPTMGTAALAGSLRATQTFGAFPSPTPTAPTSVSGTSGGWDYAVELQW